MQIEVKGRNIPIKDDLREHVEKRFAKVGKQVSELARWRSSSTRSRTRPTRTRRAEATLRVKGTTLRARDASRDMAHAINLCEDELARQVKRHRDKRRSGGSRAPRPCTAGHAPDRAAASPPRCAASATACRRALAEVRGAGRSWPVGPDRANSADYTQAHGSA